MNDDSNGVSIHLFIFQFSKFKFLACLWLFFQRGRGHGAVYYSSPLNNVFLFAGLTTFGTSIEFWSFCSIVTPIQ